MAAQFLVDGNDSEPCHRAKRHCVRGRRGSQGQKKNADGGKNLDAETPGIRDVVEFKQRDCALAWVSDKNPRKKERKGT